MTTDTDPLDLDRSILHLLHRAGQCIAQQYERQVGSTAPTPRQVIILGLIAAAEGTNQTQLTRQSGVDRSTTSEIVDRLAKQGWIRRRRSPRDKRAYVLALTDEGREVLTTAAPVVAWIESVLRETLPDGHVEAFKQNLMAIIESRQDLVGR